MEKIFSLFGKLFFVMILASLLFGFPLKWLWNWLMPDLFGLQTISFFEAVGLYWICGILFRQKVTINEKDF